ASARAVRGVPARPAGGPGRPAVHRGEHAAAGRSAGTGVDRGAGADREVAAPGAADPARPTRRSAALHAGQVLSQAVEARVPARNDAHLLVPAAAFGGFMRDPQRDARALAEVFEL